MPTADPSVFSKTCPLCDSRLLKINFWSIPTAEYSCGHNIIYDERTKKLTTSYKCACDKSITYVETQVVVKLSFEVEAGVDVNKVLENLDFKVEMNETLYDGPFRKKIRDLNKAHFTRIDQLKIKPNDRLERIAELEMVRAAVKKRFPKKRK